MVKVWVLRRVVYRESESILGVFTHEDMAIVKQKELEEKEKRTDHTYYIKSVELNKFYQFGV